VTETEKQYLPDSLAERMCSLVVLPDRATKLVLWERGPDIGAIETLMLYYGVLSTYVISLCNLLAAFYLRPGNKNFNGSTRLESIVPLSSQVEHRHPEATYQTLHIRGDKGS
jgi:hypothetical protein